MSWIEKVLWGICIGMMFVALDFYIIPGGFY